MIATDLLDPNKGYGFEPSAKVSDHDAHWVKDLLDRDSCRIEGGGAFVFDAKPGTYRFSMRGNPQASRKPSTVAIETGGRTERLEFSKEAQIQEREIHLDSKVVVRPEQATHISWIKAVRTE